MEDPLAGVVHGQQRPVRTRAHQVADDEAEVAELFDEPFGAEGDAHVVEQLAVARLGDPQGFADGAARAVRRDDVVRPDGEVLAGLPVLDQGGHSGRVLVETHQFGGEAHVGALRAALGGQFRLDVVLAAQAPAGGAEPGDRPGRVNRLDEPGVLSVGQRLGLEDALVPLQHGGGPADRRFRSGRTEQLHRPGVDSASARVGGGTGVLLDQQMPDAVTAQEQRGGQPHEGAAHDEDRYADIGILFHQLRAPVFSAGQWIPYAPR
ncbi:hypothetical protein GCM10020254_11670 [Streptomyces goshikiensis]